MCYVVRLKSIVRLKKSSIQSSFKPADLASRDGSKLEEIGVKNFWHTTLISLFSEDIRGLLHRLIPSHDIYSKTNFID